MEANKESITDIFLSKLKEQSFTIVLMLGVIYFQYKTYNDRIDTQEVIIDKQQEYIDKLMQDERTRLIQRNEYLIEQRDKYVEELINKK
jgi:pheromone shutdown protein TraB